MSDVVSRLLAAIDERERRYNERARDWREGMSDDELHQHRSHPAYLYATTEGQRKAWDDADTPPEGDGWELNITTVDMDAFTRFDYHEERYWRRLNPDGPDVWEPSDEVAEGLRLCQAHRDIVARYEHARKRSQTAPEPERILWHTRAIALIDVMDALARGYGVEDGETK